MKHGLKRNIINSFIGNCSPPLTWLSKGDIEKLQDHSFFSSYGGEIRSLTLKIETFLNNEQPEGLKQSHLTDFFQVVNQTARYTNSLYGRFYIELTKNMTYDNNPVIFIVLSSFLKNWNSVQQLELFFWSPDSSSFQESTVVF